MSTRLRRVWSDPNARHLLIATFAQLLIVICLFWAALHEDNRMELSYLGVQAKSIEHGAQLYLTYCIACHGIDGRGLAGKAPALNSPQLFGHDFFPEVTQQIYDLYDEAKNITDEKNAAGTTDARKNEIDTRLTEIDKTISDLEGLRKYDARAAIDKGYDPVRYSRMNETYWGGSLYSFILTTLIHGRPNSGSYWPQPMPAYSQEAFAGQILERYDLEALTDYIMNWDKDNHWTLDDLYAVNQFPILSVDPAPLERKITALISSNDVIPQPVGTDVEEIAKDIATRNGDAERGDKLYHGKVVTILGYTLPCTGCHQQTQDTVAPRTDGTYTRVVNERLKQPQFAGWTAEEYLIDSIVNPSHYIVPEYQDLMVRKLGEQLNLQDLADLVAYLMTQK